MKRIALPAFFAVSLLASPVSAQSANIDGLVAGCWLDAKNCVALVEGFIDGLDPNAEESQVLVGLLASELYDVGQNAQTKDRHGFFVGILRLSKWLKSVGASQFEEVRDLADELVKEGNGQDGGDVGDGEDGGDGGGGQDGGDGGDGQDGGDVGDGQDGGDGGDGQDGGGGGDGQDGGGGGDGGQDGGDEPDDEPDEDDVDDEPDDASDE